MRYHPRRRGISEIIGTLLMLAIVVTLGVLIFSFASGGMNGLSETYAAAMAGRSNAVSEKFAVEQVAFFTGSAGTLGVDGNAIACFGKATQSVPCTAGTSSGSATLTTTNSNDVIVVLVSNENAGSVLRTVSGVSATGLTFLKRSGGSIGTTPFSDLEVWYATASSPLASVAISVTLSGITDDASVVAFGVSGANTATPWDPNVSLPTPAAIATTASIPSVSGVSTTNANDMVFGFTGLLTSSDASFPTETAGSGFALVTGPQLDGGGIGGSEGAAEYKVVSVTQSSSTVAFGTSTDSADNWIMIGDAIQASTATSGADVYVRNVGAIPTTLVAVYITDMTSDAFVSQTTISITVGVGAFGEIPPATLSFAPSHGHTYSFTVTSSLGNSAVYTEEAT